MSDEKSASRLSHLSEAKKTLLEKWKRAKYSTNSDMLSATNISRYSRSHTAPLSFAQQRLWFIDQLEPEKPTYIIPSVFVLQGSLSLATLEKGIQEIVQRHEVLRTTFRERDGQPVQYRDEEVTLPLPVIDLRGLVTEDREALALQLARTDAQQPFDLAARPPLRTTLLCLTEQKYILLVPVHHIIFDEWSIGIFIKELALIYEAAGSGKPSPLSELPIQYADFTLWQREWLQGEVVDSQMSYWKQQLASLTPLELPVDHPRPAIQTFQGKSHPFTFTPLLSNALRALSRQEDVTFFMTMLASFQVLIARHTGQSGISVVAPIAQRDRSELRELIGFFVNTLVFHTDLSGNPSFKEVLRRVRLVALGAYAHQDLPFEQLVEAIHPKRDTSYQPLLQIVFAFETATLLQNIVNASQPIWERVGIKLDKIEIDNETAKYDIAFHLADTPQGLRGVIKYNRDLFEADTIARLLLHWQMLLESIVSAPDTRIGYLPLLTPAERKQMLDGWNATQEDYPPDRGLAQMFEEQVLRTPGASAVTSGEQRLSYHELNQRANQLAHYLRELGVDGEVLVGVCLERSIELMIALLGIFKAGGAYVPIDLNYPQERIAFMLDDTQVTVLLTQESLNYRLPVHQATLVLLDRDWPLIAMRSQENVPSSCVMENLAYVLYTSGSTGHPKGVMGMMRNLAHYVWWASRTLLNETLHTIPAIASVSFDGSLRQLFPSLVCGTETWLIPAEIVKQPDALFSLLRIRSDIGLNCVPTFWQAMLETLNTEQLSECMPLFLGGEALSPSLVQATFDTFPNAQIWNIYGPTETTANACIGRIEDADTINIGRPIANAEIYILDAFLEMLPVGVPGELYIGGAGVSRGYLHSPALTAEKFIPHPYSREAGKRIYRTGDIAHYRSDGTIEILGRIDQQMKVRGFRIEPREIEVALEEHPTVGQCVVQAREDMPGRKQLVAYVVPREGKKLLSNDLRNFLQTKLPEHLVPLIYVAMDTLPQTSNGKIDRRVLPKPEVTDILLKDTHISELSPTEEVLTGIWHEALNTSQIGLYDNFFELGGHSLLATQLISRVRETFKIAVSLRSLFEDPTIAGLAEKIEKNLYSARDLQLAPSIMPVARTGAFPLSFAQQRLWFLDRLEPDNASYNTWSAIRLQGQLDSIALERSLQEIVQRHESLRTIFPSVDDQPQQVILSCLPEMLRRVDLRDLSAEESEKQVQYLLTVEAQLPFNLACGPLMRAALLLLSSEEHIFLLNMHHIISDAWSKVVFFKEFQTLYQAFSRGGPSPLRELPIQYADYALWQRNWLQGEVLEKHIAYWKQQLGEHPPILQLPTAHPHPAIQTYRGARQVVFLSAEVTQALKRYSQREGVTLFMTLLAAFQVLLARYTGQQDIVIGSPIANRNRLQSEGLIGFFINTLVLRTDLSGNPTFRDVLARVREVTLDAYTHQDLPFEKLVEELKPERNLSHPPLFQVMFNMVNTSDIELELPGLKTEFIMAVEPGSKFDLTLYSVEQGGRILLQLMYNPDLFEEQQMVQMLEHLQTLLASVITDHMQTLSMLSLHIRTEQQQYVNLSNCIQPDNRWSEFHKREIDTTLAKRFALQVLRYPDAIAVKTRKYELTYTELHQGISQVSQQLLNACPQIQERIALLFEHDAPMIVGIFAVLQAGKTYVPLDPSSPRERTRYILDDAQVTTILTNGTCLALAKELTHGRLPIINIDERPAKNLEMTAQPAISPDAMAYILYTSGSTGQPKGVMQTHRNVLHFMRVYTNNLHISSNDKITQLSSYTFDAAVMDIFGALLNGATLCPIDLKQEGIGILAHRLDELNITLYHSTPTVYRYFMQSLASEQVVPGVRIVILGGEEVYRHDVEQYRKHFPPPCLLINGMGPTESTVALQYILDHHTTLERSTVPVGYPVEETEVFLLTQMGKQEALYGIGEIAIRSAHVAPGYWQRPELTQRVFLPDPEGGTQHVYLTGDLGRLLPDGKIEFVGRKDRQVKIRGYRIEIEEVEGRLRECPEVNDVAVVTQVNAVGEVILIAYIVISPGIRLSSDLLRERLRAWLPDYMLPAHFIALEALPLTLSGKIDLQRVPMLTEDAINPRKTANVPYTDVERELAHIWQDVLGVEQICLDDNFFDLGGHSLNAGQVISRMQKLFGREFPLRMIFEKPALKDLVSVVEAMKLTHGEVKDHDIPLVERGKKDLENLLAEIKSLPKEKALAWLHLLSMRQGEAEKKEQTKEH